ncbi:MAG: DEAD/DEAH box helicase family protein [bacterium]|nr:DEAD/DEAH box helicase family protein [bacterium]
MFDLYYFQKDAVKAIFDYFWSGKRGNPLVVAPTGSGKSVIIAGFCEEVTRRWPGQKVLILSHTQEILEQDFDALEKHIQNQRIGLYSAGMKSRTIEDITVAGINSVHYRSWLFTEFDIIIVDEAHSISAKSEGMYRKFFNKMQVPVIGLTATPFRLGHGYLHLGEDAFFDEIVYNIPLETLEKEGFVCPLSTKGTDEKMDATGIKKQAGDFRIRELSLAFDRIEITKRIITEMSKYKEERKKWLLFGIDISHVINIADELKLQGIKAEAVYSGLSQTVRKQRIQDYKDDKLQALVSVAVLTTGFDVKRIDLIGLLRSTTSPVLHTQILGRGRRIHPTKENCLVLDFAGNMARLGTDKNPLVKMKGEKGSGDPIMKECPSCREMVHAATRNCPLCNFKFLFKHHLNEKPFKKLDDIEAWHPVDYVEYDRHVGSKRIPMMRVTYHCGLRRFKEYVCVQHGGKATYQAAWWWKRRCKDVEMPRKANLAVELSDNLVEPTEIFVLESSKYPEIKDFRF